MKVRNAFYFVSFPNGNAGRRVHMYIADGLRKLSTGGNAMYDSAASTCHIVLDADGPTVQSIRLVIICTCT